MAKKKNSQKKIRACATAVACASIAFAIAGASAFFTDRTSIQDNTLVGNFDMKVEDLTNLDANYRTWTDRITSTSALAKNGQQDDGIKLPLQTADQKASQADSTGIINPGDTGLLAFKVSNNGKKSMDTAAIVTVEVKLADGAKDDNGAVGTLSADTTTDQGKMDAGAYTIEGLGTPVVTKGRYKQNPTTKEYTDEIIDADKNVITLRYYTKLETLAGSVEKTTDKDDTHNAGNSAIYAYNVDFDRALRNKFQGAAFRVNTAVYAKQHRDSFTAPTDFETIGGSQGTDAQVTVASPDGKGNLTAAQEKATKAVDSGGGQSNGRSNVNQTHVVSASKPTVDQRSDWSMIADFAHVVDGSTTGTAAFTD